MNPQMNPYGQQAPPPVGSNQWPSNNVRIYLKRYLTLIKI